MKIIDMHVHTLNAPADPAGLIANLEKAGIWGACVFSNWPAQYKPNVGTSFDERLKEVMSWTRGYEDRLFPVVWIHPYEENIIPNIHRAVECGVRAFKIICGDFFVYEEQCMTVLREIASLNKPVFFHSGILWDGMVSSAYNRPLNWEALMEIEGLRFSMGHCSWPWIDECIAMYGKFLNSLTTRNTAEMFFDITPGTPEIYREELLTKLYTIGYDVGNNIMFGTDATANVYNSNWAAKWLKKDREILERLGVSKEHMENLYYKNLMRFLGIEGAEVTHESPVSDADQAWSPVNPQVAQIIEKWYKKLQFPYVYDAAFRDALAATPVSDAIEPENYDLSCKDGKRNLLSYLYFCEQLEKRYAEKGIDEAILLDTLQDIVRWTHVWTGLKGELYQGEIGWLDHHMNMRLFKLGRLQFCMGKSYWDIPEAGVQKGDNVIEIHIPREGVLDREACEASLAMAKEFFAKYYPEFEYKCFTCHSWLLDTSLAGFLPEESNILRFQDMFSITLQQENDAILQFVFRWNTNRWNLADCVSTSSFAERVKKHVLKGGKFYVGLGFIVK